MRWATDGALPSDFGPESPEMNLSQRHLTFPHRATRKREEAPGPDRGAASRVARAGGSRSRSALRKIPRGSAPRTSPSAAPPGRSRAPRPQPHLEAHRHVAWRRSPPPLQQLTGPKAQRGRGDNSRFPSKSLGLASPTTRRRTTRLSP